MIRPVPAAVFDFPTTNDLARKSTCSHVRSRISFARQAGQSLVLPADENELVYRQLIVRVTVVLCVMDPDVPFNVSVYVPTVACFPTAIVTLACAEFTPFNVT
jgi:hypothetical protein